MKATSNPKWTIFVGRLSFKTAEKELEHAFKRFGNISSVRIVRDQNGKSWGYGFIEFKHA